MNKSIKESTKEFLTNKIISTIVGTKNSKLLSIIGASVLCVAIIVTVIVVAVSKNNKPKENNLAQDSMSQTETVSESQTDTEKHVPVIGVDYDTLEDAWAAGELYAMSSTGGLYENPTLNEKTTETETQVQTETESQEQQPEVVPSPEPAPAPEPAPEPEPAPTPEPAPAPQPEPTKTITQLKAEAVEVPLENFSISGDLSPQWIWDNEDGTEDEHEINVDTTRWFYDGEGHKTLIHGHYVLLEANEMGKTCWDRIAERGVDWMLSFECSSKGWGQQRYAFHSEDKINYHY